MTTTAACPLSQPAPRPLLIFGTVALPLFVLYLATLAPTVTGEDSGELITAAHELGVAHPPGYPLWLLLVHGFQATFPKMNPAEAANFASAVVTAIAMGLLALVAYRLTRSLAASVAAAWLTGVGHEIWTHATIAEVYPLNLLILSACLLLLLRWRETPSTGRLLALTLVYGAGISHHPTFLLFLPVFAGGVIWMRPRTLIEPRSVLIALCGLFLPLLVYAQVWIAAAQGPYITWGVEPTLEGVWSHFMREIYAAGPEKTPQTLGKLGAQVAAFARFHIDEMTLPGWIAGMAGLLLLLRQDRKLAGFLMALVLVGSFGLIPLLNFDIEREDVFVNRVFLMPAYLVLGLGLAVLFVKLIRSLPAERGRPAAATALLVLPLLAAGVRFSAHDRSNYYWAEDYARALLEPLPKDTVLVPGGDTTTFPVIYLQRCLGKRRDVLILDRSGTIERECALELLPPDKKTHFAEAPRKVLIEAVVRYGSRPVVCMTRLGLSAGSGYSFEPFGVGFMAVPGPLHGKRRDAWVAKQREFIRTAKLRNLEEPTVSDYTTDVIQAEWWQVRPRSISPRAHPPRCAGGRARAAQHAARHQGDPEQHRRAPRRARSLHRGGELHACRPRSPRRLPHGPPQSSVDLSAGGG